jgi:uncharacterized protein (TIGR02246 family)
MNPLTSFDAGSIERFTRDWESVFDRADHHLLASFYTEDATLIATHMPTINGRTAIEEFWRVSCSGARAAGLERRVHVTKVESAGELAVLQGTVTLRPAASAREMTVRYVTVWKRQPDRCWRIDVDISSAAPPPDGTAP